MAKRLTTEGEIVDIHCEDCIPFFKTPYNHNRDAETIRTATFCPEETKTQQHFKEEQDINIIVARVLKTGVMPDIPVPGQYADLSTQEDYHTMLNRIAETNGLFYKLDPELRAEYKNDPGAWLQDVNEKLNQGDLAPLREMGLDMASVDAQIARLKAESEKKAQEEADAAADARASQKASKAAKE